MVLVKFADTALKTANSGYLTRQLCDVAQDVQIKTECDPKRSSVTISEIIEGGNILELSERILGRVIAENIKNPVTEVILKKTN